MKKTISKPTIKKVVKKRTNQPGKWIFRPLKSTVLICACGNKYISTRLKQTECVSCTYRKVAR